MEREELILKSRKVVKNIIYKYKKKKDEDLESVGIIHAIRAIDYAKEKHNYTEFDEMFPIIYTWCKNGIINYIKKENYINSNCVSLEEQEKSDYRTDLELCVMETEDSLNDEEKDVFRLLISGTDKFEIMSRLHISERTYYYILENIKQVLQK